MYSVKWKAKRYLKYIDKNIKKNKTYSYKIQAIYSNSKLNSDKTAEYNIKVK